MHTRFSLLTVSCLILLAATVATPVALAQAPDIFVTPVPNAPFTAVIHVERSFVLKDGSIEKRQTIREIGRDSQGRIFNQYRMLLPLSITQTPDVMHVLIYDPQTRTSTTLFPPQRMYRTGTVNRPPETMPPAFLDASANGGVRPQNQFTKQEDLGIHEISGLPAHGVRETQNIQDAGKDTVVTDEVWYSEDLRINLVVKHDDPRTGSVSMTVTQVQRTDPDPAFFKIPEGFTLAGAGQQAQQ